MPIKNCITVCLRPIESSTQGTVKQNPPSHPQPTLVSHHPSHIPVNYQQPKLSSTPPHPLKLRAPITLTPPTHSDLRPDPLHSSPRPQRPAQHHTTHARPAESACCFGAMGGSRSRPSRPVELEESPTSRSFTRQVRLPKQELR